MDHLPLKDFNLVMETINRAKKITFQWSIRNINKLPGQIRSSKFSLVSGKPQEWDVCIWHASDGKFRATLGYHAQTNAIPIEIRSASRIMKKEGSLLGSNYQCTNLFFGGDQHPLIATKYPESEDLVFQCSMAVHGCGHACGHNLYSDEGDQNIEQLRNDYLSMMKSGEFADVKIKVGNRFFSAHRCVFKCRAPKFFSDRRERIHRGQLTLVGVTPDLFEVVLQNIYHGKVNQAAIAMDFELLFCEAVRYELRWLLEECIREIIYNMKTDNVCRFYILAEESANKELMKYCEAFIIDNLRDLQSNVSYKKLAASRTHLPRPIESNKDEPL